MKNYKVEVKEASDGTVTATASSRTVGQAVGDSITTLISDNEASVGYVKTAVQLGLVYGGALFGKYRGTGNWSWNPI